MNDSWSIECLSGNFAEHFVPAAAAPGVDVVVVLVAVEGTIGWTIVRFLLIGSPWRATFAANPASTFRVHLVVAGLQESIAGGPLQPPANK